MINITTLYKDYENAYNDLLKVKISNEKTIGLLNDICILSVFQTKGKNKAKDVAELFYEIANQYGEGLFFSEKKLFEKHKNILQKFYNRISNCASNENNALKFEKLLGSVLEKHINRKKTGSYYTPEDTTKFICWNSIFISILNKLPEELVHKVYVAINITNNVEFIDKKLTFEEKISIINKALSAEDIACICNVIRELKIIDPTCGSGAFVISAYECIKHLNEKLLKNKLNKDLYYLNLYGVDISNEAVMLTKTRIIIKTYVDKNFNIDVLERIKTNFISGDSLKGSDSVINNETGLDWRNLGLFDCIVGNPPYVESKSNSGFDHYLSKKCGNLYAYSIERACNIADENSIISFVVPLSLIATKRMSVIREYLESKSSLIYYCTFADRPGCLFTGVHQRLTIFFANIGQGPCRRFTSTYKFWYKDERPYLFKSLDFIENNNTNLLPKIGSNIENSVLVKNRICSTSLYSLVNPNGEYTLYVSSRIGFWAKAFMDKPSTNEIIELKFDSDEKRKIAYCVINSSLFYFIWVVLSDCWHVSLSDLKNIRFNLESLSKTKITKLLQIADELSIDLENNKIRINTKQTEFEYKHKLSKKIIDKIDDIICPNSGLDHNETKFIKNYTLKYRLNKIDESEEA